MPLTVEESRNGYLWGLSMSNVVYDLGIGLLRMVYSAAAWVHPKARAFRDGRREQSEQLRESFPLPDSSIIAWFHCASLGEFEQGRPVMEALRRERPSVKILLTFFSPSGYEVRKNYAGADFVFYLPWDTRKNADWFVARVRPSIALFVKYEFWHHYTEALHRHHIPMLSVSAIFRPDQIFFKPHGALFRKILHRFTWFFVQNEASRKLLNGLGISSVTVAGDTRFDRVAEIVANAEEVAVAEKFKGGEPLMVIGSAWPEDMAVLLPFLNAHKDRMKFIVAPHEISESGLTAIQSGFSGTTIRYSGAATGDPTSARLLLVDTIGLLSRLYRYGEYAFVGGGYKQGLHNILEAACYGVPVFFGSRAPYDKYQEAIDLTEQGGAFAVADTNELTKTFDSLHQDSARYARAARTNRDYVQTHRGATGLITTYLLQTLDAWKAGS